jgi:N utilization substance protein B
VRHEIREAAFLLLFQQEINNCELPEVAELMQEQFDWDYNGEALKTAAGAKEYSPQSDKIIESYSPTRAVKRISKVNLTILRIAIYEMDNTPDDAVPDVVAINEAIELAKEYADKIDSAFINGVLSSYLKYKQSAPVSSLTSSDLTEDIQSE